METNKNTTNFNEGDELYWKEPSKYALVREEYNGISFYTIYTVDPVLLMKLCDDFEYALKLSKKMIENGVRVFDDFKTLYDWYLQKNNVKR